MWTLDELATKTDETYPIRPAKQRPAEAKRLLVFQIWLYCIPLSHAARDCQRAKECKRADNVLAGAGWRVAVGGWKREVYEYDIAVHVAFKDSQDMSELSVGRTVELGALRG